MTMGDSILDTIKQMLGIDWSYTAFDTDILVCVNTVLLGLDQIGLDVPDGFTVQDSSTTWDELLDDRTDLNAVKTYIYIKTRLMFDPPTNSAMTTVLEEQAAEIEWRLCIKLDMEEENEEDDESDDEEEEE